MAILTTVLGAEVVPAASIFRVQCVGGTVVMESAAAAGGTYCLVPGAIVQGVAYFENPVAGTAWRAKATEGANPLLWISQ